MLAEIHTNGLKKCQPHVQEIMQPQPRHVQDKQTPPPHNTTSRTTPIPKVLQEIPRGQPECLKDKTFVITGVLDSLWRNEAEDLIKRHSGRVTGSVSGKTTFLLAGTQAGKSKMKTVSRFLRKGTSFGVDRKYKQTVGC